MKKLAFILLLIFILALQAPAFAEEPVIDGRQNLITRLYTGGASDFVIGDVRFPLAKNDKIQSIALIGDGQLVKLSWSAYKDDDEFVVELKADKLIAPGIEKYQLLVQINDVSVTEAFRIEVLQGVPIDTDGVRFSIPSTLVIGESFSISAPRCADGSALPAGMRYVFRYEGTCLADTGDNRYIALREGEVSWSLKLVSGNYTSAPILGAIMLTSEAAAPASVIRSVDLDSINTHVLVNSLSGYELLGYISVSADVIEGDCLSAWLEGANEHIDLYLGDSFVEDGNYVFPVLASDARSAGTEHFSFTASAGCDSLSASFEITLEDIPAS